jgi:hypothetical protein
LAIFRIIFFARNIGHPSAEENAVGDGYSAERYRGGRSVDFSLTRFWLLFQTFMPVAVACGADGGTMVLPRRYSPDEVPPLLFQPMRHFFCHRLPFDFFLISRRPERD